MIKIYTSNSCASCKKAIDFLKSENIPYVEKNISRTLLSYDEIKEMIIKSPDGSASIISTRSNEFKDNKLNVDDMTLDELINFIIAHPTVLKRPIIYNEHIMQVGYNEEDIEVFLPIQRKLEKIVNELCGPKCKNYNDDCLK